MADAEMAPSRVLVFTGDGKGKTTAAVGIVVRAWARGWRTTVVQFVKSGRWRTGERALADHLGIDWHEAGDGFTWTSTDPARTADLARSAWDAAAQRLASGDWDLVVCDEISYLCTYGWVDDAVVAEAIRNRPTHTSVVLTGRGMPDALCDLADTVTEMRSVRHAYEQGIRARKGIEY